MASEYVLLLAAAAVIIYSVAKDINELSKIDENHEK